MSNDVSSGDTNVITLDSDVTANVNNEVNMYVCFVSVLIHLLICLCLVGK